MFRKEFFFSTSSYHRAIASGGAMGAVAPPQSQQTIFLKGLNLRARLRADLFLSSFSKLKSREMHF